MTEKKAQVTAFILIGILLLVIYALAQSYLKPPEKAEELALLQIPEKARPVKVFVDQCIEQSMRAGIETLGLQGGYLYLPHEVIATQYATVAYWYNNGLNTPTIFDMEQQLKVFAEEAIPQCVQNLTTFRAQWDSIQLQQLSARVTIANETVLMRFGYPIQLIDRTGAFHLENFTLTIPVKLGQLHALLKKTVEQFAQQQPWLDITLLATDAQGQMMPLNESHFLLMMSDNYSIVKERPFQLFAALSFVPNTLPEIQAGERYEVPEGQLFSVQWQVLDEDPASVVFTDDTILFDITPTGLVSFTPQVPGTYEVKITATDNKGKQDMKKVIFVVTDQ